MSPDELVHALHALKLSQEGAARLIGHTGRGMRRWIAGDRSIPPTVAILIRLLVSGKITPDDVREAAGGSS